MNKELVNCKLHTFLCNIYEVEECNRTYSTYIDGFINKKDSKKPAFYR